MILLLMLICFCANAQNYRYNTTRDYIFARYDINDSHIMNNRNVMRLTSVFEDYQFIEYQLAIAYNSPNTIVVPKGTMLKVKLFNNQTITLYSCKAITESDNISYKEQVKIRHKAYFVYPLTTKNLNDMLKHKVYEIRIYLNDSYFIRYSAKNMPIWEFNEVLQKEYEELLPFQTMYKTKKKGKPGFEVDRLYKEGRISYLEGDSLIQTDENIRFDIKWIE